MEAFEELEEEEEEDSDDVLTLVSESEGEYEDSDLDSDNEQDTTGAEGSSGTEVPPAEPRAGAAGAAGGSAWPAGRLGAEGPDTKVLVSAGGCGMEDEGRAPVDQMESLSGVQQSSPSPSPPIAEALFDGSSSDGGAAGGGTAVLVPGELGGFAHCKGMGIVLLVVFALARGIPTVLAVQD